MTLSEIRGSILGHSNPRREPMLLRLRLFQANCPTLQEDKLGSIHDGKKAGVEEMSRRSRERSEWISLISLERK